MSYLKVAKNATIYTIFSIFSKAVNFILLPLYTTYLTTEDYGIVGIITALTAFLSTIYLLSLNGSINRFFIEYTRKKKVLNALFSTIFTTVFINATIWTIICISCPNIFNLILPGINFYPYIFWGLLTVWLRPFYLIYQRILQAQQKGKKVALLDLSYTIINICLTILFIVVLKQKAEGVIKAQTLTALIIAISIVFIYLRKLKWEFSPILFRRTLRYSLPLIPHSLAGVTSTMIDRFVINKFLGAAEVGIYNIAFQFGNLSNILTTAFNQAYVPWFNEQVKNNNNANVILVAKAATFIFSIFAMGISLFSEEILNLFAKGDFLQGSEYIPYLAFAYALNGVYYIFASCLFYDIRGKGVRKLALISIFAAFINLTLNIILVPIYGIYGAAYSFIMAKFLFAIITGITIKNNSQVKINVTFLLIIVLISLGVTLLANQYLSLISKTILFLGTILLMLMFGIRIFKKSKLAI